MKPPPQPTERRIRVAMLVEQILGHVPFGDAVRARVEADPELEAVWLPVLPYVPGLLQRAPVIKGNWTLLASLRARGLVNAALRRRDARPDVLYFHTQIPAVASVAAMKQIPTVVSLDATRPNMETLQAGYGVGFRAKRYGGPMEAFKDRLHTKAFAHAAHLVTWSDWVRDSLIRDYGVTGERITTIPPGVDLDQWAQPDRHAATPPAAGAKVKLLFVGGQFDRKGGPQLLEALRSPELAGLCELDVVTQQKQLDTSGLAGVRVHTGLKPNSPELRTLYRDADAFVLPTLGDTFGIVLVEAMASGLPVVATRVGAIHEVVDDGKTGLLVPPADVGALRAALVRLVGDAALRRSMGQAGVGRARDRFDGRRNNGRLVELLKAVARRDSLER